MTSVNYTNHLVHFKQTSAPKGMKGRSAFPVVPLRIAAASQPALQMEETITRLPVQYK